MNEKYTEICFNGYTRFEEAVATLQEYNSQGELVCGTFNGHVTNCLKVRCIQELL